MSLSLYIHIPFCISRCIYCDFVSEVYDRQKADTYIRALMKELAAFPDQPTLSTLYIGGGTPTSLSIRQLTALLKRVFSRSSFINHHEATLEANPGTFDKRTMNALLTFGINRISIGIQSFNDNELRFLGRIHSSGEAVDAVLMAKDAGFKNIGIDLMYGIPGQSMKTWKNTLHEALRLEPAHISTYELTREEGTVFSKYITPHSSLTDNKQDCWTACEERSREEKAIEMYTYAIDLLRRKGYIHYEISNFSLPGYQCIHNINYWERGEYYGAGLGAHSFMEDKRFQNVADMNMYLNLISQDKQPTMNIEAIDARQSVSEAVFLGLRMTRGLMIESFSKRYNIDLLHDFKRQIEDLQEADLIEVTDHERLSTAVMRLTQRGMLLSNEVFEKFL